MNRSIRSGIRRVTAVSVIAVLLVLALLPACGPAVIANDIHSHIGALFTPLRNRPPSFVQGNITPPTDAQCRQQFHEPCYSPQEMRNAYGLTPVLNAGYTGKGQTIVIIDSYGSPTIRRDLWSFDKGYGLPNPPSFQILAPLGTIQFNPNNPDMVGWAAETTLDVEWSHAMAPDANIVLMTSPVDETEGVQGLPEFLYLEQYALYHNLGKIISQSWGATENTLFTPGGRQILDSFNDFYQRAAADHVTVFASAGDSGAANVDLNGKYYQFPTVNFPASSPYVTAVGGTSLYADINGSYDHEVVWNDGPTAGATGGGISQYNREPDYQQNSLPSSIQRVLGGFRGLPDIAYNANYLTPILVYVSYISPVGFYFIGGTSEGSPQWAGIIADGNQMAGHPLGFLNPTLYSLGPSSDGAESFHDITIGNNSQQCIRRSKTAPLGAVTAL